MWEASHINVFILEGNTEKPVVALTAPPSVTELKTPTTTVKTVWYYWRGFNSGGTRCPPPQPFTPPPHTHKHKVWRQLHVHCSCFTGTSPKRMTEPAGRGQACASASHPTYLSVASTGRPTRTSASWTVRKYFFSFFVPSYCASLFIIFCLLFLSLLPQITMLLLGHPKLIFFQLLR